MSRIILILFFLLYLPHLIYASEGLKLGFADFKSSGSILLSPHVEIYSDPIGTVPFDSVASAAFSYKFQPLTKDITSGNSPYYWIRFTLENESALSQDCKISIPFADYVQLYYPDNTGLYHVQFSGDMVPLPSRSVKTGKLVFFSVFLPARSVQTFYFRCESRNDIALQFREVTLRTINLYSQRAFEENFSLTHIIYQSLFFGALIIMLLYNFFIFITLKDSTYLTYVGYTFLLIIFIASNDGFLLELVIPDHPKVDLYIRFLSPPLLIFFYVLFSKMYLKPHQYAKRWTSSVNGLLLVLPFTIVLMIMGYWNLGRNLAIISAMISFIIILCLALESLYKGYTPAKFFLIANILLMAGGMTYSLDRFTNVTQNLFAQYSLQLGIICEVTFFSFGLAARINLTQLELKDKTLQNERLEKEKEIGLKRIIEEKNRELEEKVIERTFEVVHQKEEIIAQNELLSLNNKQLEEAEQLIRKQNLALSTANTKLEKAVLKRTKALQIANQDLIKSNQELDMFIYRTAHDIKGPLARLIGLSNVALLDVQDNVSISYLQKLSFEANYLNYILSRLSTIYEINHWQIAFSSISFEEIIHQIFDKLKFVDTYSHIKLSVNVMENIDFCSDEKLITFILQNLLENAMFFHIKDGGTQPQVAINVDKKDNTIIIAITDNGRGILPEEVPTIFDMFSKAAGKYKTAGMGLYMARLSAKKLEGDINLVKSEPGYTEFLVKLPYLKPSSIKSRHLLQKIRL